MSRFYYGSATSDEGHFGCHDGHELDVALQWQAGHLYNGLRNVFYIHHRLHSNIAIGLGNAPWSEAVEAALWARRAYPSSLVREHVAWALEVQRLKRSERIATDAS